MKQTNFKLGKKTKIALAIIFLGAVAFSSFAGGINIGVSSVWDQANQAVTLNAKVNYEQGLSDMQNYLDKAGIFVNWKDNGNGSYNVSVIDGSGVIYWQGTNTFNAIIEQRNSKGELVSRSTHAMSVTNYGKDWVEQQLFNPNATTKALYISSSNNTGSFDAAWTALPGEYVTTGLARATGSYVSTGVGAANVSYTFSITGTGSTQLYGISAGAYATDPNTLIAAEQQGAGAAKNMVSGDTLAITVQWSHA